MFVKPGKQPEQQTHGKLTISIRAEDVVIFGGKAKLDKGALGDGQGTHFNTVAAGMKAMRTEELDSLFLSCRKLVCVSSTLSHEKNVKSLRQASKVRCFLAIIFTVTPCIMYSKPYWFVQHKRQFDDKVLKAIKAISQPPRS
jgi:hypothetical protein